MSSLRVTYDGIQHATAFQQIHQKSVASDACTSAGGKGEELSPVELVGAGLASCMLFSMGILAVRDKLDVSDTVVEVEIPFSAERIESIDLRFVIPRDFSPDERTKLERAAFACPIKRSFHPDIPVSTQFTYRQPVSA